MTAPIVPSKEIVEEDVWQPLSEIQIDLAFAFGKPWLGVCEALGTKPPRRSGLPLARFELRSADTAGTRSAR